MHFAKKSTQQEKENKIKRGLDCLLTQQKIAHSLQTSFFVTHEEPIEQSYAWQKEDQEWLPTCRRSAGA